MPIPWAAAAKAIPWSEVIAAAPGIVKGARELWKRAGRKPGPAPDDGEALASPDPQQQLEVRLRELERELRSGSELIGQLAEQNQRLVFTVDRLERRLRLLGALMAAALAGLALALWLLR